MAEIRALVTPDNKAFDSAGARISAGSSIKLLEHLAPPDAKSERLAALLAEKCGKATAKSAVKNYANEIVDGLEERRDINRQKETSDRLTDIETVKTKVRARIASKRETGTPRRIEITRTTERGLSR
jgi:hypothetical protein